MDKKIVIRILTIGVFLLILPSCNREYRKCPRIFISDTMQEVIEKYFARIGPPCNDYNNLNLTEITVYSLNGEDRLDAETYPTWGVIIIPDKNAKPYFSFIYNGSYVKICATPDCSHYLMNRRYRLSNKQKIQFNQPSYFIRHEIIDEWHSDCHFTIKPNGTVNLDHGMIKGQVIEEF